MLYTCYGMKGGVCPPKKYKDKQLVCHFFENSFLFFYFCITFDMTFQFPPWQISWNGVRLFNKARSKGVWTNFLWKVTQQPILYQILFSQTLKDFFWLVGRTFLPRKTVISLSRFNHFHCRLLLSFDNNHYQTLTKIFE